MDDSRFIVGIDLGTTNIAVYYVDTEKDDGKTKRFPIPQLTAPGEVGAGALLPSFCYLPAANELPAGALALPWEPEADMAVGVLAREHGAGAPARLISSAKSWLAHAGVDRRRAILPWGSELGEQMMSPVAATGRYLVHIKDAWNERFGTQQDQHGSPCLLPQQQVTLTIPASFDETARELTLAAAREAGLGQVSLLEEPLAAFYAWLSRHEDDWQEQLAPGEKVLILDVGGGTTDLSFIEMDDSGTLHRFAVGDHLLLGGDNIDMAVGRELEREWNTQLDAADWALLCQLTRQAKEELLNEEAEVAEIALLGSGSSVVRNARRATLPRERLVELMHEGFFPAIPADAPPPKTSAGMRQMGLPYAAEPAVTVHLLQFLRYAARVERASAGNDDEPADGLLYPDRILFNGGSMKAKMVRQRVLATIGKWFPGRNPPRALRSGDLSMAVAIGAAYYGRVRRGLGVKVRGGIARSYFIEVDSPGDGPRLVCVMARDTDENVDVHVPGNFLLQTNQKVVFRLYSSATRLHDRPGETVEPSDELSLVAPLLSVLQFGQAEEGHIEVGLASRLTEVGTLELHLESRQTEHRWPLKFDLRPPDAEPEIQHPSLILDAAKLKAATGLIDEAFGSMPDKLPKLLSQLEGALGAPRDEWSLPTLRELADALLARHDKWDASVAHTVRWLNLTGYCLRPGFGEAADELRLRQLWKSWFDGPAHAREPQALAEWWVFWRRLAPGLRPGHQGTIGEALAKELYPKRRYLQEPPGGKQATRERWRCLGALELLSVKRKHHAGELLLARATKLEAHDFWVLARLGGRCLFHAPANMVMPASIVGEWLGRLLRAPARPETAKMRLFAIARLAALTGDRSLDLSPEALVAARQSLAGQDCPESWRQALDRPALASAADSARILGDSLPLGLAVAPAPAG